MSGPEGCSGPEGRMAGLPGKETSVPAYEGTVDTSHLDRGEGCGRGGSRNADGRGILKVKEIWTQS